LSISGKLISCEIFVHVNCHGIVAFLFCKIMNTKSVRVLANTHISEIWLLVGTNRC
jgi:hypothetical protein